MKKSDLKTRNLKAIAGVQKYLSSIGPLMFGGASYAPADLVKLFQEQIDDADASDTATAARHAAVQAQRTTNAKVNPLYLELRAFVESRYGNDVTVLTDFGFLPKKPKVKPAVKVEAAVKAQATRAARRTMGKRQKAKVHGPAPQAPGNATPTKP